MTEEARLVFCLTTPRPAGWGRAPSGAPPGSPLPPCPPPPSLCHLVGPNSASSPEVLDLGALVLLPLAERTRGDPQNGGRLPQEC